MAALAITWPWASKSLTNMLRCAILLLLLASCANPFRGIPTLLPVGYQATCQLAQDTLYLETQAKSKVVLTITPQGERSQGVSYVLQDWHLAGKMQGALLDAAGKPLQPGTKLTAGEHTFFYKPSTVGEHQLLLSTMGLERRPSIVESVSV